MMPEKNDESGKKLLSTTERFVSFILKLGGGTVLLWIIIVILIVVTVAGTVTNAAVHMLSLVREEEEDEIEVSPGYVSPLYSDTAGLIYQTLTEYGGLDMVHACAVMGNLYQESSFNYNLSEVTGFLSDGSPLFGGGLMGWSDLPNGTRQFTRLKETAASEGKDWTDITFQMQYAIEYNMKGNTWWAAGYITNWKDKADYNAQKYTGDGSFATYEEWLTISDLKTATYYFCNGVEMYTWSKWSMIDKRIEYATEFYKTFAARETSVSVSTNEHGSNLADEYTAYALSFVGKLPYVWGGVSLTTGADCSGFVSAVLAKYGLLSQTVVNYHGYDSLAFRSLGAGVSVSDIRVGDVVCYKGHVAMYIGNGKVVQEPSPGKNCNIGDVNMAPILTVRRFVAAEKKETAAVKTDEKKTVKKGAGNGETVLE